MVVVGAMRLSPCPQEVGTGGPAANHALPVGSFHWGTQARSSLCACRIPGLHFWLVPERCWMQGSCLPPAAPKQQESPCLQGAAACLCQASRQGGEASFGGCFHPE